jgi:hypothetical protein
MSRLYESIRPPWIVAGLLIDNIANLSGPCHYPERVQEFGRSRRKATRGSWAWDATRCVFPFLPAATLRLVFVEARYVSHVHCHKFSYLQGSCWRNRSVVSDRQPKPEASAFASINGVVLFCLLLVAWERSESLYHRNAKRRKVGLMPAGSLSRKTNDNRHRFPKAIRIFQTHGIENRDKQVMFRVCKVGLRDLPGYNHRAYREADSSVFVPQTSCAGLHLIARALLFFDIANAVQQPECAEQGMAKRLASMPIGVLPKRKLCDENDDESPLRRRHMSPEAELQIIEIITVEFLPTIPANDRIRKFPDSMYAHLSSRMPLNMTNTTYKTEISQSQASRMILLRQLRRSESSSLPPEPAAHLNDDLIAPPFFHISLSPYSLGGSAPKPPKFYALSQVEITQQEKGAIENMFLWPGVEFPQPGSESRSGCASAEPYPASRHHEFPAFMSTFQALYPDLFIFPVLNAR